MRQKLTDIVAKAMEMNAFDVHIKTGFAPMIRIAGVIRPLEFTPLSPKEMEQLALMLIGDRRVADLKTSGHADAPCEIADLCRVRVNVFFQRNSLAISMRLVPKQILEVHELGFSPKTVEILTSVQKGMILLTGATNCGKSTTLAALVHHLARHEPLHVVSIEDPIEYVFPSYPSSLVSQRQVGEDTPNFLTGLIASLREDPDVIVLGELRDQETVETALKAAETGHLVISTLHTGSAVQSLTRMINIFPSHQRDSVRYMLASCVKVIVAQTLLPSTDGKRRVMAYELMPMLPAVRNLLRQRKIHEIGSILRVGRNAGCVPMVDSLKALIKARKLNESDIPHEYRKEMLDQEARHGAA